MSPALPSHILFESSDKLVVCVDIPRSLEESQVRPGETPLLRILAAEPVATPFPVPGGGKGWDAEGRLGAGVPHAAALGELMTGAAVQRALAVLRDEFRGSFYLPRIVSVPPAGPGRDDTVRECHIPRDAVCLDGSIAEKREEFLAKAPPFDLIVLDPPWPNRSAQRKKRGYRTLRDVEDTRSLLAEIPIAAHLAPGGLVAVWVTNRHSLVDLLTSHRGLFAEWGLELVAEWTWLKVTTSGEPIFDLESTWRRPWERLLLARRRGENERTSTLLDGRVIVAVPDVHSRKPNLRYLFGQVLQPGYRGLEIFARTPTAGWWSWGDELTSHHIQAWIPAEDDKEDESK